MKRTICRWLEDEDGTWWADCGEDRGMEFTNGIPSENKFVFCPYCGKPLVEVKYEEKPK